MRKFAAEWIATVAIAVCCAGQALAAPAAFGAPTATPSFDPHACRSDPGQKLFVSFVRSVFAFRHVTSLNGDTQPLSMDGVTGEGPPWSHPLPKPPDAREPEGCPEHPVSRFSYGFDAVALRQVLGGGIAVGDRTSVELEPSAPGSTFLGSNGGPIGDYGRCPNYLRPVGPTCLVRTFLRPGLFMLYYYQLDLSSTVSLSEQIKAFDDRLRRALLASEVVG